MPSSPIHSPGDAQSQVRFLTSPVLLWLAGTGLRLTILAVPPVIPLIHDELNLSATEIGILTGLELKRQLTLKGVLLPLGAGLSLLAMLGSGGERTDLGAHFMGLVAGCAIGAAAASFPIFLKWCNVWQRQLAFFIISLLLVLGAWLLAFS